MQSAATLTLSFSSPSAPLTAAPYRAEHDGKIHARFNRLVKMVEECRRANRFDGDIDKELRKREADIRCFQKHFVSRGIRKPEDLDDIAVEVSDLLKEARHLQEARGKVHVTANRLRRILPS